MLPGQTPWNLITYEDHLLIRVPSVWSKMIESTGVGHGSKLDSVFSFLDESRGLDSFDAPMVDSELFLTKSPIGKS